MQGSSRVTAALLRDLPTFTGLSDAQLERISEIAVIEELPAQQALLRQGGPAHTLRIVVTGKLSLCIELVQLALPSRATDVDDLLLNVLGAAIGSLFAVSWLHRSNR